MHEDKPHLLIVDDDERLRALLYKFLTENGFHVSTADDAQHAVELMDIFTFDLGVLDVMMPGETGFELTLKIRTTQQEEQLPLLMLTAMGEVEDRIEGLSHGADDYLTKPFDPRELLLRINAILRRSPQDTHESALKLGDVTYSPIRNTLTRGKDPISLTSVETTLLKLFSQNIGKTLTREKLAELLDADIHPRSVDVLVTRLRKKFEDNPRVPRFLQTIRGQGYALVPES